VTDPVMKLAAHVDDLDDDGHDTRSVTARASVAQQTGFSSDTYVTSSGLLIPADGMVVGMWWEWVLVLSKTGAGTAAPAWTIRIGSGQSTSDTSRWSQSTTAQTADADSAIVTIRGTVRTVSATGTIRASVHIQHNLAATGFASGPAGFDIVEATSSTFDNTALAGLYIGLSVNGGASAAWTLEQVIGRLYSA
jgi:hypothetical protein